MELRWNQCSKSGGSPNPSLTGRLTGDALSLGACREFTARMFHTKERPGSGMNYCRGVLVVEPGRAIGVSGWT